MKTRKYKGRVGVERLSEQVSIRWSARGEFSVPDVGRYDVVPDSPAAGSIAYLLRREPHIRADKSRTIGCALGFRKAAKFSTSAELESLRNGEDSKRLYGLIASGLHPAYRNGTAVVYRPVTLAQWDARRKREARKR